MIDLSAVLTALQRGMIEDDVGASRSQEADGEGEDSSLHCN